MGISMRSWTGDNPIWYLRQPGQREEDTEHALGPLAGN
jgi:hypothetical protein